MRRHFYNKRFLGRPFASHGDAVSELIGQSLEHPIEDLLVRHGISYRKTARLNRALKEALDLPRVPDFVILGTHLADVSGPACWMSRANGNRPRPSWTARLCWPKGGGAAGVTK